MATLAFNSSGYRNWVMMSKHKRLLVEGPDDKRLFKLLFDALQIPSTQVDIDTAEYLIEIPGAYGNRSKVEALSETISALPFSSKFVGFVDREYRSFDWSGPIVDLLGRHNEIGRLVWSRGHSVENYYFDFATLREPLREFSVTEHFDAALDIFQPLVPTAIGTACAIGLAARDIELQTAVRGSLRWTHFSVNEQGLRFDERAWHRDLLRIQHLDIRRARVLLEGFRRWTDVVRCSEYDIVRWLCDGHLGLAAAWAGYGASVAEACARRGCGDIQREVSRVLAASESVRFNACAAAWTRQALGGQTEYPMEVLRLLGMRRG